MTKETEKMENEREREGEEVTLAMPFSKRGEEILSISISHSLSLSLTSLIIFTSVTS